MNDILSQMQIKYLADVPHLVNTMAQWTLDAWGRYDPDLTLESQITSYKEKLNKDKVPIAFVVMLEDKPIATVNLKTGIPVRGYTDRNLWLGSFIVAKDYQHKGVGSQLLEHVYKEAKKLGYKKISLFSSDPNNSDWYARNGWHKFASDTYQGFPVSLFERDL